jgi:hypothetical protein
MRPALPSVMTGCSIAPTFASPVWSTERDGAIIGSIGRHASSSAPLREAGSAAASSSAFVPKITAVAGPVVRAAIGKVFASPSRISARQPASASTRRNSSAPPVRPGSKSTVCPSRRHAAAPCATSTWPDAGTATRTTSASARARAIELVATAIGACRAVASGIVRIVRWMPRRSRTVSMRSGVRFHSATRWPRWARAPASAIPP